MGTEKKVYLTEEVAEVLRCNVQTVRKYVQDGTLKAFRLGTQIRIKSEDLDAFMRAS